jgi:hypothetical protein
MTRSINNKSNYNISEFEALIHDLCEFATERLGTQKIPVINFISDDTNHPHLGKTGYYDPNNMEITIYVDDRHPKDMMRSIAHELVHHMQNEKGMFDQSHQMTDSYAQKDPHLRKMEAEAYLKGNMCFRDWEDQFKSQNKDIFNERRIYKMSTKDWKNKELNTLLNERWGFSMDLGKLNEASKPDFLDLDDDGDKEESMKDAAEDAKLEEEVIEECGCEEPAEQHMAPCDMHAAEPAAMVYEEGELPADNPEEQALADLLEDMLDKLTVEQLRTALKLKEQGNFESEK